MRVIDRRAAKRVLTFVVVAVILWLVFVWVTQRAILFPARFIPEALHVQPGSGVEVIWHEPPELAGGRVEAWFIPGRGVDAANPGPVVIHAHGNGELIDVWYAELTRYTAMGVSVFLPEYRGYGRSAGSPTQDGITRDFVAFHDVLVARPDVDPQRVVFHGRSLGGGALAALAEQRPPAAMILESSFTHVASLAARFLVPPFMVRDRFDTHGFLAEFDGPVLIIHGERDEVIPVSHAHHNHAAARDSRLVLLDFTHNTPPPAGPYWDAIETFLGDVGIVATDPP
jgi:fermentation-respiration switch protein FrsA (DUF1100 family)